LKIGKINSRQWESSKRILPVCVIEYENIRQGEERL